MKNCIASQNNILKHDLNSETMKHLSSCKECKEFLETQNLFKQYNASKVYCPEHLTFENLRQKSSTNTSSNRISFFKYASLVAAALLIIGIYVPKSFYLNNNSIVNSINIAKLNEGINTEIDYLEDMINYAENSLIIDEKVIDGEILNLFDQIDNIEEV